MVKDPNSLEHLCLRVVPYFLHVSFELVYLVVWLFSMQFSHKPRGVEMLRGKLDRITKMSIIEGKLCTKVMNAMRKQIPFNFISA